MKQLDFSPIQKRNAAGFSLIELLIGVAIVGILAAIAYPSYTAQLQRTARTDAQSALLDLSSRMELFYANQNTYVGATVQLSPDLSENGDYKLTIAEQAESYVLSAVPQGSQSGDMCGTYTIDSIGTKGSALTAAVCW